MNTIRFSKLDPSAKPPYRKNPTDAGMDFYALQDANVWPQSMHIFHTGISVEIPEGFALILKPKSRNNHLIGAGVLDAFYEPGEVLIKVVNIDNIPLEIKKGDAIAQGLLVPVYTPALLEVPPENLKNNHERSEKGGIVNQI